MIKITSFLKRIKTFFFFLNEAGETDKTKGRIPLAEGEACMAILTYSKSSLKREHIVRGEFTLITSEGNCPWQQVIKETNSVRTI